MANLLRILVGAIGVGLIVKFTPILDILYLFFMIVMIPMMLMLSLGLITGGTFNLLMNQGNEFFAQMRERVQHHRETSALGPEAQA